ncbi:MAG: gamma-glutamyl-gamma-aminobutyrate hydrolase family protein [Selenomonadaceae bacterium]|nr:gamma-glutamyl-gamma-aminobutyrate hydrolase family protein [Selenomonadaceae bacterium]
MIVLYSQRVELVASYGERRDCADQMIPKFLRSCDLVPIPVPNIPNIAVEIASTIDPRGIFLSGGNDLGSAPDRDETERRLLEWAIENERPTFGICRGMQFIAHHFGAALSTVENHVRVRHAVNGLINRSGVNSFHKFGLIDVPDCFEVLARADDGSIEAIGHKQLKIAAVGWHPEREAPFVDDDIAMIQKFFR